MPELKTSNNPWLDESFNKNTAIPEALGFNIWDIVERLGIGSEDPIGDFLKGQNFLKLTDTPDDYGQAEQFARSDGMGQITWDWPYWVKRGSAIHYAKGKVGVKTPRPVADFDVKGSIASRDLTLGSVPFIKANSIFTDDNDKFFWHDASKQLNVGDYDISIFDDFEDDFSDGTIGAGWSTHNTDANRTIVEAVTTLTITTAASTDGRWVSSLNEAPKLYKAVPSPPFEFIAKFSAYAMPTNNVDYGIFIGHYDADQANEKFAYKFEKKRAGDGSKYIQVNRPHGQGGLEAGSDQYLTMDEDGILWFKIAVDESEDVRFYVSDDFGSTWFQMQKSSSDYAWSGFFDSGMEIGFFLAGNVASETVAIFSGTTVKQAASDSIIAERFKLTDSDTSNLLKMLWNEDDSGDRTLNLKVRGGSRTIDLYENFAIGDGYDVTITALGQANAFTMNEAFTIGDGNAGTLTYSAASKTLTVEDNTQVNQDLTTDAAPVQFHSLNLIGSGSFCQVDSSTTARFIADAHDADAYIEYQEDNVLKWTAGYDYSDGKYKISEGVPGTNTRLEIIAGGSMNVSDSGAAHLQILADSNGTSRLIARSYTNDAYVELKEQATLKWCAGYDYTDGSYRISEGAPGTNDRFKIATGGIVTIPGALILSTVAAAGVDTDKFLVLDGSDYVDYRTGAQLADDIEGNIDHGNLAGLADVGDHNWSATKTTGTWSKSIGSGGDYADWATMIAAMPDLIDHMVTITLKTGTTLTEECELKNRHSISDLGTISVVAEKYYPNSTVDLTADSATATTLRDAALATAAFGDDYFNGCWVFITDGTGTNNGFVAITDYTDATGDVIVSSWPGTQPDNTSRYKIVGALVDGQGSAQPFQVYDNNLYIEFKGIGFKDSDIYNMLVLRCTASYFYYCGFHGADISGVRFEICQDAFVRYCAFVGNNTDAHGGHAGLISRTSNCYIRDCAFSDNSNYGAYFISSSFSFMRNCFGDANGTWGTYMDTTAQVEFVGTECSGTSGNHFYAIDNLNPGGDICTTGNIGIGSTTFGANAEQVLLLETHTAPTSSPADAFQMYSADIGGAAGKAGAHFRDELGLLTILGGGGAVLDKTSGKGIKIDTSTPTFGWRDLLGQIRTRGVGATDPNDATYIGNIKAYQFVVNDECWTDYHIPHDYVPGTDIFLHFHWSHISAIVTGGSVTWAADITYAKGHNQAAFPATVNTTIVGNASTTQYQHIITEVQVSTSGGGANQIDTDNLEPDGVIMVRGYLSANNITSGGAVPDPFLHFKDIHYQSTNIATKNKVPDFYA